MNVEIAKAIESVGTQARLAELSGLSQQHISRLLNGRQKVTGETALKIVQATDGKVSKAELCPHLWPKD